ncbi:MAG: alpha/beta hydrolase [Anaerolineae bacterium]|nr:alpha/beta hydrolase [Anaerolineae bacterium]
MERQAETKPLDEHYLIARKLSWQQQLFRRVIPWLRDYANRDQTLAAERAEMDRLSRFMLMPRGVTTQTVMVGDMPATWITPANAVPGRALLHAHGGGFITGSRQTHRALVARLTLACRARALVYDYRLAPEHAHPAALDDTLAAYSWLRGAGFAPAQIILCGDSAGGALVLLALLKLRDAGDPLPSSAVCLSPVTDLTGSGETMISNAERAILLKPEHLTGMPHYVGAQDASSGQVSPLFADLHDLPPLLILAGSIEILLSDATRFADKALAAGVDATLEVWPGMWHDWPVFAPFLPEAQDAIRRIGAFVEAVQGY